VKRKNLSSNGTSTHPRVRILLSDSGRGLQIDADLLQNALQQFGCEVEQVVLPSWSIRRTQNSHRYAKLKKLLPTGIAERLDRCQVGLLGLGKTPVALQIHLESVAVEYLAAGALNWLIPNQEWVRPQHLCFFNQLDRVLVKTQEAEAIMRQHHAGVGLLGFSNPIAEAVSGINSDLSRFRRFLHVAGRNRKKGTQAIVDAWRRHPEWPVLQLVVDDTAAIQPVPANVNVWQHPDDEQLVALHRANGIVLAPSEVEGYGHILVEGMAFQGVVVTTDAAPMNELVQTDRGYLVPWGKCEPCHLGTRYFVDAQAIEKTVTELLVTPAQTLLQKSLTARAWVISNHAAFTRKLRHELDVLTRFNPETDPVTPVLSKVAGIHSEQP
jgi:hypothetical protein